MPSSLRAADAIGTPQINSADIALARRHAPVIQFCDNEPFLPSKVGISVLNAPGRSPSSELEIAFEAGVAKGIFKTQDVPEATRAVWVLCRSVADWYKPKGPKSPAELAAAYVQFALALVGGK